ncbi:gustatory and pheromone receptor 32a-like [Solenopsis invicta]|uniref:gustatory and pheromone receptor 32a-like n=1 Tax=Solenopsis invicta TaxID=13686 RepID=UPI00193E5F4A|nr:gustatory and pheromone receptor 32a-like [Solenopsis invicta]
MLDNTSFFILRETPEITYYVCNCPSVFLLENFHSYFSKIFCIARSFTIINSHTRLENASIINKIEPKMEQMINVQVEDNSLSIENTLGPISYISWLMGVGVARPRKCPKAVTIIIRIVHLAVCSIKLLLSLNLFLSHDAAYTFNDIYMSMYTINWVIFYMAAYYYVYNGIKQYDMWPELMDRLKDLDQKIRKEISMNDWPVKKIERLAIFATFACCPLLLIVHALYYYFTRPEDIYASDLLLYYLLAQSLINSFVFNVIVYVLYYRFRTINKLIDQLDRLSDASWFALKIRRIRELHNSVRVLVIMVNDIYGFHIFLCSASCFTMVVTTLFKIYMSVQEKNYKFIILHNFLWILYITQFSLICRVCTLAREESQRTGTFIYAFVLKCRNLDGDCVRNEVNDFSIQLQQYRVSFTACNFFEISNALFTGFIVIITTNLIILLQFYKAPDKLKNFFKTLSGIYT